MAKKNSKPAPAAPHAKDAQSKGDSPFAGLDLARGHGPVDIRSDALSLDYKHNSVVFRGHVHAVQGDTELSSDILQISYGKDFHEIKEMVADKNVRISQGGRWATGDHAVLDRDKNTVVLTGSPVVHEGSDQITGKRITVFLDTGQSEVEGARAVIFPHQTQNRDNGASADHAR